MWAMACAAQPWAQRAAVLEQIGALLTHWDSAKEQQLDEGTAHGIAAVVPGAAA